MNLKSVDASELDVASVNAHCAITVTKINTTENIER